MVLWAGERWREGEPEEGWARAEDGRVIDEGVGRPRGPAQPAVLLEGLFNYHTHVGDAFLRREDLPRDLVSLVAPGTGLKHRRLQAAAPHEIRDGIRAHLEAVARLGVTEIVDFREQGAAGVRLGREAASGLDRPRVRWLGRPALEGSRDAEEVVALADGLGAPSVLDLGRDACAALAAAAHARGKPFALHASEAQHEAIEDLLALDPDLLVHLCAATRADLRLVADSGVPVAICPGSNAFFGFTPPAAELEAVGVAWYLGTDNAMLGGLDPVDEARRAREAAPGLPLASVWRALTTPTWKAINRFPRHSSPGAHAVRVVPLGPGGSVRWDAPPVVLERSP